MMPFMRRAIEKLVSDEWQMALALSAGIALLTGFSLLTLVDDSFGGLAATFHHIGHALVWVSLGLGSVHGLKAAWESARNLEPDIDVLMVVGAALAAGIGHPGEGALLLFMFSLAGALEHRALAKAKDAVTRLTKLMPDETLRRENDSWIAAHPKDLAPGDLVLVRPGETIPADGAVEKGHSTVDQSTLSGESLPRTVVVGEDVYAGTLNQNGALEVRVSRPAGDSSLQRILDLVIEAQERRQPMQRLIDRFSTPYTLSVFALAGVVFAWFGFSGRDPLGNELSLADAAYRAITLLIVASPCALVIATPTATLCGLNRAARAGLLVKGGDALERLASVRAIALDKTGTLTSGRIEVTQISVFASREIDELLPAALALEERSTHPIATAIARDARHAGAQPAELADFAMTAGSGLSATVGGEPAAIGTLEYVAPRLPDERRRQVEEEIAVIRRSGGISAVFALGDDAVVFALADQPRPGARAFITRLREAGVDTIAILTGDSRVIAENLAADLGVDTVHAGLLPEQKVAHLEALRPTRGGLAVLGDGVNDAPALATADVGLAMGGVGADAALETADVVILNDDLSLVPWALRLARGVRGIMLVNLLFAIVVIAALATGSVIGWVPMGVGVVGHEGSTIIVVANSLRLLAFASPKPFGG